MMVACSNEELNVKDVVQKTSQEAPVQFDVYAQRNVTRGGVAGTNDNENIGERGFGVFAYYTAGEQYDTKATPNFMYNQKVTCEGTATVNTQWTYEPVKYWPNEFGNAAVSDEVDYVTFFAYAPWTEIEPTTGQIVPKTGGTETVEHQQTYNIISVNKNNATGDPIVKYVVDTDPATSVDLLWGVAAETADKVYTPIDGTDAGQNKGVKIEAGKPFLNLVKPNNPQADRLQFNLKHALAKLKVTIDYIADDFTPAEGPLLETPVKIKAEETRIYVRNFKMSGFAMKGALNLNNTVAGEPLWKDFDGVKDLTFDEVTFQDGRKDGKEGETNGAQSNESPQGLNPNIVENYAVPTPATEATPAQGTEGEDGYVPAQSAKPATFGAGKTSGVTEKQQLLFGGEDEDDNEGFFYVIPRNETGNTVDMTITYDVETIDPSLAGKLSDGETHGISIENVISKSDIFGGIDFMAGKQYEINIHIGMTSVKIDATVTDWKDNGKTDVELPDNQEPYFDYYWKIGDGEAIYTSNPYEMTLPADRIFIVDDEASFNAAYSAGPLKAYYDYFKETDGKWYDPDPVTGLPSWAGLSTDPHNPAQGFGLPWIVFDMDFNPAFVGDVTIKYEDKVIYGEGGSYAILSRDGTRPFIIMDGTDLGDDYTSSYLTWNDATHSWVKPESYKKLDPSKFTVTLQRTNVKKYSYKKGELGTEPLE